MKVAIATSTGGLEDMVSAVFGRCPTYTMVDFEGEEIKETKVEQNPALSMPGGAGIAAAQFVADAKAEAVIAGNFGPNAVRVFSQAGVKMYTAAGMKVEEAVRKLRQGGLQEVTQSTLGAGTAGMGSGPARGMGRQGE
jgi:predicted Fe-Mo cluster-binding NifX family protein